MKISKVIWKDNSIESEDLHLHIDNDHVSIVDRINLNAYSFELKSLNIENQTMSLLVFHNQNGCYKKLYLKITI